MGLRGTLSRRTVGAQWMFIRRCNDHAEMAVKKKASHCVPDGAVEVSDLRGLTIVQQVKDVLYLERFRRMVPEVQNQ